MIVLGVSDVNFNDMTSIKQYRHYTTKQDDGRYTRNNWELFHMYTHLPCEDDIPYFLLLF